MKHAKVWITIGALVAIALIVGISSSTKKDPQLPSPDATLMAPQPEIPVSTYIPTTPLSKNKIILKNGMKIEITKEGTGEKIATGNIATVQYVGKLENGTTFDQGTIDFELGAGRVIKGWEEGVLGMRVGESRTLTIPPALAYGPNGYPPVIPPNATLVFDVTLMGVK